MGWMCALVQSTEVSCQMCWQLHFNLNIFREFRVIFVQNNGWFQGFSVFCIQDLSCLSSQDAVAVQLEDERLVKIKEVLKDLPALHYRWTQKKDSNYLFTLMWFSVKAPESTIMCFVNDFNNPHASCECEHAFDFKIFSA